MEDLGIPELTNTQIEELCIVAEKAARSYVQSKVPKKEIENLVISAEVEGTKPVDLRVDVAVSLTPIMKDFNVRRLVDGAVKEAFRSADRYLRDLACRSQK